MTHKSQLEDPLYKNWVKGGLASKYLKEGIEDMIDNALLNIQRQFLSNICNHLSLTDAKCTNCTTTNCIPCPTKGICNITGKGRDKKCSYHVKGDPFKEHRKCPNDICDSLHTKITNQHRYGRPAWQNTDATKWCTNHWEIAKCFLPGSGYSDKISVEDTDCSGLLNLAVNCLDVQTHLGLYLEPPNGILSQILTFRNKIFHSASLSLTTEELEEYIDLMIRVLQDKNELAQDPQAQTAVLKLEQLKDEGFFISTKDEEEIRHESILKFQQEIKDDYLGRKQELQDSLCKMYEEHFKTIPISPLLDDIEAEIDDVFVELVLCDDSIYNKDSEENSRQNCRTIENYKDILYNDKDKCKNIYVIGDAGMGKSTWCMKMLRNWVSAKTRCSQEPDHHSNPVGSTHSETKDGQQILEKDKVFKDVENQQNKRKPVGDAGMGKSTWCMKKLRHWVSAKTRCSQEPDHHSNPVGSTHSETKDGQQIPEKVNVFKDVENQQNKRKPDNDRSTPEIPIQNKLKTNNLNKKQYTKVDCLNIDQKIMAEFEIVLFVALRHASGDGNIRDMIKNQLFEEKAHLDELTTEVLRKEPDKCLIIVDGLDEWTRPANVKCSSLLQHPSLPGRKGLNGCPILTTTRPWKLNDIRLQSKDIDKTIKIQGIEDVGLLANKLISCKNKTRQLDVVNCEKSFEMFEIEVQRAFHTNHRSSWYVLQFLRVPLILIFMVCSWYDNGQLENSMAGNFNGFMQCLFSVAEKGEYSRTKGRLHNMEGFISLKNEWSKCSKYLPRSLQEIEQFPAYSQLLIKLGKLAFDSLFTRNYVCLVFTESELRSKLTIKELEVAVKVGILSQSKVVGKSLTHMSSLSFLHKTIQEYLAAVFICSSADGHKEAKETLVKHIIINRYATVNVLKFVKDINLSPINELCKYCAKNDVPNEMKLQEIFDKLESDFENKIAFESNSCRLYGAALSGTDHQTLEIKTNRFLELCKKIPDEDKEDDDITNIEDTMTWCTQSPHILTNQLRTVKLLRVNINSSHKTEMLELDISHCKHLEDVSFANMHNVEIKLNHSNLKNIKLENISTSDLHVTQTATRVDCHVKQVKMIHIQNSESCKLSLPAVFLKIDMLSVIESQTIVIKIDPVMDTSVANRHVINTVHYTMSYPIDYFKMELGNELEIDTLILRSSKVAQNNNIKNPFFAYLPRSLIVESPPNYMLTSESLCLIAQNTSLTCLMLKSNLPNYTVVAKCISNMKQLVKLHIDLTRSIDGTKEIMRALQSLPRLEDLGLTMYSCTFDTVAEYLPCMTQLKRLKLCQEYVSFNVLPEVYVALSTSIYKLSNIEKLELKCVKLYNIHVPLYDYRKKLLNSVNHLSRLKHLHCDIDNQHWLDALSTSLSKMVDLESLNLNTHCLCQEELFYYMTRLIKLKHLTCTMGYKKELQALSKSVLTMTNLKTLDVSLKRYDNEMLHSLEGIPQLTRLKCDDELQEDNMTALLKSIPKLVNLETLSLELDCDNKQLNKSLNEMFSLNEHLQFVTVEDSSKTGCGVMASSVYTVKYCNSYNLPRNDEYYVKDYPSVATPIHWELTRQQ